LESEKSLSVIEDRIREIDLELDQEEERKKRLAEVEKEFKAQNDLFDVRKQLREQQMLIQQSLKSESDQLERQQSEIDRLQSELDQLNALLKTRQEERAELKGQLAREKEIQSALLLWEQARQELTGWDALAANFQKFDQQRHPLLQEITNEQTRLDTELNNLQKTANSMVLVEKNLPILQEKQTTLKAEVNQLAEQAAQRPVLEQDLRALADQRGQARAENDKLAGEGKELNERIDQLAEISAPRCPVCGKPLSDEERARMIDDLKAEVQAKRDAYQKNNDILKGFSSRYAELEARISHLDGVEKSYSEEQRALDLLEREIHTSEQVLQDWTEKSQPHLQELEQKLKEEDFALDARQKLAEINAQLKELGYDASAHEAVKKAERDGRASQEAWVALEKARSTLAPLEREIEDRHNSIEQKESHLQELRKEFTEAKNRWTEKQASLPPMDLLDKEYYDLQEVVNRLRDAVSQARNEVKVLDRQRQRKAQQMEEKEATQHQIAQLKVLEKAFGKDGIPALLIEQALPEIQNHANEILDRLSDGNMAVRFETQREFKDKKREDRKETLDILIRDAQGERDYELFSGGEAFRVNFAIRLALSRVLSHRAGARLQTLVIDEGFGSQDAEGRQASSKPLTWPGRFCQSTGHHPHGRAQRRLPGTDRGAKDGARLASGGVCRMKEINARLGLQQRVLPEYRVPFVEALAQAALKGLSIFAGQPRQFEAIKTESNLTSARYVDAKNLHIGTGGFYTCVQTNLTPWLEEWQPRC
jgi:exonuclease SbcC